MITTQQFKKATGAIEQINSLLETVGGIIYCFLCAVLISFPLYALLHVIWFIDKAFDFVFAAPQDEKPTAAEIMLEEDIVISAGGAFND